MSGKDSDVSFQAVPSGYWVGSSRAPVAEGRNKLANPPRRVMLLINMKMVLCGRGFIAAVAALWLSSYNNAHAQTPGGPGPAGVSAALTKLFGKNTAFSAKGEMQVTDRSKHEMSFWS